MFYTMGPNKSTFLGCNPLAVILTLHHGQKNYTGKAPLPTCAAEDHGGAVAAQVATVLAQVFGLVHDAR